MNSTFDVRNLPAAKKRAAMLSIFDGLNPGEACEVVCDFDPARLARQFDAFFDKEHSWICLQEGPPFWRIEIGKRAAEPQPG
ncbi:DUF2249 domain-containing protein [Aminobacter sp. SR38]|jgi:uncharacterized protein (DUF2249 family)|uniref:DUF2249 domain-containing protein n=1 Tax=Aminobacter sp. SR38 TaxID=2774562 RepID=UPI001FEF0649|nr:DUF2249 domain-containing protein [Aminobacter sp. SR38]